LDDKLFCNETTKSKACPKDEPTPNTFGEKILSINLMLLIE